MVTPLLRCRLFKECTHRTRTRGCTSTGSRGCSPSRSSARDHAVRGQHGRHGLGPNDAKHGGMDEGDGGHGKKGTTTPNSTLTTCRRHSQRRTRAMHARRRGREERGRHGHRNASGTRMREAGASGARGVPDWRTDNLVRWRARSRSRGRGGPCQSSSVAAFKHASRWLRRAVSRSPTV